MVYKMKIYSFAGAEEGRSLRVPFFNELLTGFVLRVRLAKFFDCFLYF